MLLSLAFGAELRSLGVYLILKILSSLWLAQMGRYQIVLPIPDCSQYVLPVFPGPSQSFSAEMKIYFNKDGVPLIREHEIEAGNVDSSARAKCTDG